MSHPAIRPAQFATDLTRASVVYSQNALNHVNLAPPVGTLNSPLFGKSIALSGASAGSANRTVSFQTSFRF